MSRYAVLITDQCLVPPWGGNRVRIWGLIEALRRLGWRVALVTIRSNPVDQLRERVDELFYVPAAPFSGGDVRAFDVQPYQQVLAQVARALRPSLAIAEYAWLTPALRVLPRSVLRWVDCHEILSERTARFCAAGLDPWIVCSRELESRLLRDADVLLAIQPGDEQWLRAMVPGRRVACLLPFINLPDGFRPAPPRGLEVLFVGTVHAGNHGIGTFLREHWAGVAQRVPGASLRIVGSAGQGLEASPSVELVGQVASLAEHYASAAVVLCPIEVGTGIKIKMIEALRHGRAVVATEVAAEGLPAAEEPAWVVHRTLAECADSVVTLLSDAPARSGLAHTAFSYAEREFSLERFLSRISPILPGRTRRIFSEFRL